MQPRPHKTFTPIDEPVWYRVQVERKQMKALQARTNWHGVLHLVAYVGLMGVFGTLTVTGLLPTWARVLSFVLYATVFCFCEAILHETNHRTAFRTSWLNEAVHWVAGLLNWKEPIRDRWLHAAHHTYTSYPDVDPETFLDPPVQVRYLFVDLFRLRLAPQWLWGILTNAVRPDAATVRFVPPIDRSKVVWSARACLALYFGLVLAAVALGSWWPILLFFVARFVGAPLNGYLMMVQHGGLALDVPDWRLNSRTTLVTPLNRLLVWNMTFHVEHHMYPTVPFHALPRLHAAIAYDCPPPYTSTLQAWREMVPALVRSRTDPSAYVQRPLPRATVDA